MTDYNGYANRSTRNVVLWMNKDEGIYLSMRDTFRRRWKPIGAADAEDFFRDLWPNGVTPDGDALRPVYWGEVADAINEDLGLTDDERKETP